MVESISKSAPIEHIPSRPYTTVPDSQYLLPTDATEKQRLERQHRLITETHDGKILLAPVSLKDGDKVLDSATGSGIWLLDLAKRYPETINFYGIDIQPRLFPAPSSLGPNLHFQTGSVLALPDEWSSTFSLVNQRLLMAALTRSQWALNIPELYRVLAPGGWIQLIEAGTWKSGPLGEKHKKLYFAVSDARDLNLECSKSFPSMLSDAGFENVQVFDGCKPVGKWAGNHAEGQRDNLIALWRGMKSPILNTGGFGVVNSEQEYDDLVDAMEREYDETPGSEVHWVVTCAQKPLAVA